MDSSPPPPEPSSKSGLAFDQIYGLGNKVGWYLLFDDRVCDLQSVYQSLAGAVTAVKLSFYFNRLV